MKGLVYNGPFDVSIEHVTDARIEAPTDAVVRITTTNICGSDLHMYEGRTDVEQGKVRGHENMGIVEAVGAAVGTVGVGARVSLPFTITCGTCDNCEKGLTAFCLRANPGQAGAAYGYASMGPYGGPAEYLRVPRADVNCLPLPAGTEHELDHTMLSDVDRGVGHERYRVVGEERGATAAYQLAARIPTASPSSSTKRRPSPGSGSSS